MTHPFGELINCPICFDIFEGRILMCTSGHAVCEKCQLNLADCPICRSVYIGTRNYQLEDMVSKLKEINLDKKKNVVATSPKSNSSIFDSSTSESSISTCNLSNSSSLVSIPQIAGSHLKCQILNCLVALPICRLYNHIRYHHVNFYREVKVEDDTTPLMEFKIAARNYRHAIKISKFGLFFLIINVIKENGNTTFKGWVQGTIPNKKARSFKFSLALTLNNLIAEYSDLCYGYNQTSQYVEASNACLNISTSDNIRSMVVKLTISRNLRVTGDRGTCTKTSFIEPIIPTQQNTGNRRRGNNRDVATSRKNKR